MMHTRLFAPVTPPPPQPVVAKWYNQNLHTRFIRARLLPVIILNYDDRMMLYIYLYIYM